MNSNIYIYGLQRSGTNIITSFLKKNYNINIINNSTKYRSNIKHKHCRIYTNKKAIPIPEYKNNYIINNLEQIDILLGDNNHKYKYIIVYKNIFSWLPSIFKWGKKCKWMKKNKMNYLDDYLEFFNKWNEIKNNRVLFINYDEYLDLKTKKNKILQYKIESFFNLKTKKNLIFPQKVNCSKIFLKNKELYYINKEYMKLYSNNEILLIKNHILFKKNINNKLVLGSYQGYIALKHHMKDALLEANEKDISNIITDSPSVAIFSHKYYNDILKIDNTKKYDYCFIGSINSSVENRQWVIDFAKSYFTSNSYFVNTDSDPNWKLLGDFDYSIKHKELFYNPKEQKNYLSKQVQYRLVNENIEYFKKMSQSKFILCPAGDSPWSFRFYETLMCRSIPIVIYWHHTYRTRQESKINYKYFLSTDIEKINMINNNDILYNKCVDENTSIYKNYHLL